MPYQSRAFRTSGRLSKSGYASGITETSPSVHERYATSLNRFSTPEYQIQEPQPIGNVVLRMLQDMSLKDENPEQIQYSENPPILKEAPIRKNIAFSDIAKPEQRINDSVINYRLTRK